MTHEHIEATEIKPMFSAVRPAAKVVAYIIDEGKKPSVWHLKNHTLSHPDASDCPLEGLKYQASRCCMSLLLWPQSRTGFGIPDLRYCVFLLLASKARTSTERHPLFKVQNFLSLEQPRKVVLAPPEAINPSKKVIPSRF